MAQMSREDINYVISVLDSLTILLLPNQRIIFLQDAQLQIVLNYIPLADPPRFFNRALVFKLLEFGQDESGTRWLNYLISYLLEQAEIKGRPMDVDRLQRLVKGLTTQSVPVLTTARARRFFISYSSADRSLIEALSTKMQAENIEHWWDRHPDEGIQLGQKWEARLLEELQKCHAVLIMLSSNSLQSAWVRREIHYASSLKRQLLPIQIGPIDETLVPLHIVDLQRKPYQELLQKIDLLKTI